jgi:hypothetical protein
MHFVPISLRVKPSLELAFWQTRNFFLHVSVKRGLPFRFEQVRALQGRHFLVFAIEGSPLNVKVAHLRHHRQFSGLWKILR